jgi:hypothetical protein
VVSRGDNRLDIVARGTDSKIYSKRYDGNAWSDWEDLGESNFSSPPAAALHDDRVVVFAIRGTQDITYTRHGSGVWSKQWTSTTATSRDPVALVSWGQLLYVFSRGAEEGPRHIWREQWHPAEAKLFNWRQITQQEFDGPSAVVSSLDGRIDIFGLGPDKKIYHWHVDKSKDWKDLGGTFDSPPAGVSRGKNRLDIFALRSDKRIYSRRLSANGSWSEWGPLSEGRSFAGAPVAVSRGEGWLDVFAQGADGQIYWYDDRRKPAGDWMPLGAIQSSVARLRAARDEMAKLLGLGTVG